MSSLDGEAGSCAAGSATSGGGTSDKPWDAPGWLPARVPGQRRRRSRPRRRGRRALLRARQPRSPSGSPSAPGSTARRVDRRRRSSSRASTTQATVFVDGDEVAHHDGMFTPFDASSVPRRASICSRSSCTPAPESEPQVGRTSRVRVHKRADELRLGLLPAARPPGDLAAGRARPDGAASVVRATLERFDGRASATRRARRRASLLRRSSEPELVVAERPRASSASTTPAGELEVGFRTVELDGYSAASSTASATSRSAAGTGCPLDALYGVPRPEKLERLLGLAQRANVNLLRVWGGGLIETRSSTSSATGSGCSSGRSSRSRAPGSRACPPTTRVRRGCMRSTRRARSCRRAARHPSLALWCGGNELDAPTTSHAPVLAALQRRSWQRARPGPRAGCRPRRSASSTTCTGRGSIRACARTTRTTTRRRRACTASSASRA